MADEPSVSEVEDKAEQEDEEIGTDVRYEVTSYGVDYPVDSLIRRMRDGSLVVPPWQRELVWSRAKASRFIESLLLGLPVPGIFLARELADTKRMMIVDGQQRLGSLHRFYEGIWEGREFALTGVGHAFNGRTYKQLVGDERQTLDDSVIHATVVKQDRPEENDGSIYMIFERINTGGMLLTPQEIRATVSRGPFNDLLGRINHNKDWRAIFGKESLRRKDQELILRFLCLYFALEKYSRPMKDALNNFMHRNRDLRLVDGDRIQRVFGSTVATASKMLGPRVFRPSGALNAAVFDSVMVGLAKRLERGEPDPDRLRQAYVNLLQDNQFIEAYTRSTSDDAQVKKRIGLAIAALNET